MSGQSDFKACKKIGIKFKFQRDEERLRAKYADFLSDTAEGRTALEAAKRIESRMDEKKATIEHAFETLKNERLLLRQERQAVHTLQGMIFQYF